MPWTALIGPGLRLLGRGGSVVTGWLGKKADDNPKMSTALTAVGGYFGLRPEDIAAVGKAVVALGTMLQSVAN